MIPLSITLRNFQSYEGEYTLDFTNINQAIICGPNGAGKSSLVIDPILFALFGTTRSDREEIINDNYNDCSVTYTFQTAHHHYIVTRTLRRVQQNSVSLQLIEDGKDISERKPTSTDKLIIEKIGFTENLLLATAISYQDDIHALINLAPAGKEKILSKLLNLDEWYAKKQFAADWLNSHSVIKQNMEDAETKYIELMTRQVDLDSYISGQEEQLKTLIVNETNLDTKISEYECQVNKEVELKAQVTQLQLKASSIKGQIKQLDTVSPTILDEAGIKTKIERLLKYSEEDQLLLIDLNKTRQFLDVHRKEMEKRFAHINSLVSQAETCEILKDVPCKGTEYFNKCGLLSKAREVQEKISEVAPKGLPQLEEVYKAALGELQTAREKWSEISDSALDLKDGIADIDDQLRMLNDNLTKVSLMRKLEIQLLDTEQKLQFQESLLTITPEQEAEYQYARSKVMTYKLQRASLETSLKQGKKELNSVLNELQKVNDTISALKEDHSNYQKYKMLHDVYKDIPAVLLNDIVPRIEVYTNEVLDKIFPGNVAWIQTHRDTKNDTLVKSIDIWCVNKTKKRKFHSLSGSEKFRFSLAFRLALSRLNCEMYNIPLNFFIIDEGFGSLDESNTTTVKNTLKTISEQFKLFLVITHVDELKDSFGTQIVINPTGVTPKFTINHVRAHFEVNIDE